MNTKEVLIAARKKIERADNWTKGRAAKDAEGLWVDPLSPNAVCWCAVGAIISVSTDFYGRASGELDRICGADTGMTEDFNDHPTTTHADVLALFDRAIAAQDGDK